MDDLLPEFLTETNESLAELDLALVKLERTPDDKATLSLIFRLVHTIKGTCGFLGLPRLEHVAHAAENVLGKVRDGELVATPEVISLVLKALDRIKLIVSGLGATGSEPGGDDSAIIAALEARFSDIVGPATTDICYATQNRQSAVRDLAKAVDMILVVGSRNSSNSNRLREIGEELGKPSYLIDDRSALRAEWFDGIASVGVTAGASAPEMLVQGVIEGLRRFGDVDISTLAGVAEDVRFRFPAELSDVELTTAV